jgi:dGTPase
MSQPPAPQTAPYACRPEKSRGRLVAEPDSPTRSCFQRDRDRIIHCGAFRRLKYKTQVFVYHEGDNYRTRLSHSLEVAQIARSIARALALNEDLAEALALAHDLGHTPFGHAGEKAMGEAMAPFGGFDHNEQTFRVITLLERRYAGFDGLNLTWETLEGTVKHNGPLSGPQANGRPVPATIARFCEVFDLELASQPGAEAQVASLADDIAYNSHDIDDGLRAGLFGLDDLKVLPLVGPVVAELLSAHPGIEHGRLVHETVRRVIDAMVRDVLAETGRRLAAAAPGDPDELRLLGRPVVAFSEAMREKDRALKAFLFERMYRHYRVNRMGSKVRRVVRDLFAHYLAEPNCLPDEWRAQAAGADAPARARLVADYIAGMTDRYALEEHHKLFDIYTKT